MKYRYCLLIATAFTCMIASHVSSLKAGVFTYSATQRGWTSYQSNSGTYDWNGTGLNNNYFDSNSGVTYRNWFRFDVSSLSNQWITSGALQVTAGGGSSVSKTFRITDFNTSSIGNAAAMWNDSASGAHYGDLTFGSVSPNALLSVGLNGTATSSIMNAAFGNDDFAIGGHLIGPSGVYQFQTTINELTRLYLNTIDNRGPSAVASIDSIESGDSASFDGSSSYDADISLGDSLTYMWDFDNDGIFDTNSASSALSLSSSQLASYGLGTGTHTVGLKVTDRWGSEHTTETSFSITAPASTVPEPASLAIFGLGAIGLVGGAIRRRQQKS